MTAPTALPPAPPVTNTAPAEWVQPPQAQQTPPNGQQAQPAEQQAQQPQYTQPPVQQYAQPAQPGNPQQQAPMAQPAPATGGWATPPPPPTTWDTRAHLGATCIVVVHKITPGVPTQYGVRAMADVTVIELLGPEPGVYDDIQFYGDKLVSQLEKLAGQYTLGRFALGQGKGANLPTVLNPPTPQDEVLAQQWMDANPGRMTEIQRIGRMQADVPKPPPQFQQQQPGQYAQPGPMQGQQWNQSPTGYGQPPQNQWQQNGQQPQQPYPWQGQQQQNPYPAPNGQPQYGSYPGQGQPDQPPF